jgi:hypothetical protein
MSKKFPDAQNAIDKKQTAKTFLKTICRHEIF